MKRSTRVGAFAAILLGVVAVVLWRLPERQAPAREASTTRALAASRPGTADPPSPSPTAVGAAALPDSSAVRRAIEERRRSFDRPRADALRQRAAARAARNATAPSAAEPTRFVLPPPHAAAPSTPPPPRTDEEERRRKYIQSAVREQYFPIARDCYQELLGRQPKASGKMVMSFSIVGAADAGVVEDVDFTDESTIEDAEFNLCMRESMYSTIFEPPSSERTTVVYPIVLEPGE